MVTKTRAEQETIIRRAADEQDWDVWSEDPRVDRKLTAVYGPGKPKGAGFVWLVPATGLSFRRQSALSAAERQRRASVLAKTRSGKAGQP